MISLSSEVAGPDARDSGFFHLLPGRGERPLHVDRPAGVLDHGAVETELARVERGPRHAEIGRQPAHEHSLDAPLPEVAFEAGAALAVGLEEGRVAVHLLAPAL